MTSNTKKYNKKQRGGRMSIPGGTGTAGNFGTLLNDIVAVIASSINTITDTTKFVKNVITFKGDMGTEFNSTGAPGAGM